MADKMAIKEANVTTVNEEDRTFIRSLMSLSPEKNLNERLRLLREEIGISRAVFGQRIGVSGDVINNLERGRVEIKEHILKLICSEFSALSPFLNSSGKIFQ